MAKRKLDEKFPSSENSHQNEKELNAEAQCGWMNVDDDDEKNEKKKRKIKKLDVPILIEMYTKYTY